MNMVQQVRGDDIQEEEEGKKLRRRSCGKTKIEGEAWLSDNPQKVQSS
jgi:hypothetical protein